MILNPKFSGIVQRISCYSLNSCHKQPSPTAESSFSFDISDLQGLEAGSSLINAALRIYLINEETSTNHDIYVAVILEDATAEHFSELTLAPSILPPSYNDVWSSANDEGIDWSEIYGG